MLFEGEYRFTKKMVAESYEVDLSTINRYIAQYEDELKYNGYFLCRGKLLKELKLQFGHVINEMTRATRLGLFNFRAVLNMGMLLTESEKAKQVRTRILDIVIATINKRAGGGTKYIDTRDIDFLPAAIKRKIITVKFHDGSRKLIEHLIFLLSGLSLGGNFFFRWSIYKGSRAEFRHESLIFHCLLMSSIPGPAGVRPGSWQCELCAKVPLAPSELNRLCYTLQAK